MIEIKDLEFCYSKKTELTLRIPALSISKGEKVFLFGPSGCGKTTLLEILAGVLVPQKGRVRILNQDLKSLTSSARDSFRANHVGYIFQSFNLISYLSVKENIELPTHLSPVKNKKKSSLQVLTDHLNISTLLDQRVAELSVGQQQRVAVARALYGQPELILADEPTSALDYDHREKFISLLFRECETQGTTLLFVSHDRTLEKFFDRSLSLSEINLAGRS